MSRLLSEEKLVSEKWLFRGPPSHGHTARRDPEIESDIADRRPAMGGIRFRIPSGGVVMTKRITSN
jgi:hypothetical protein